MDWSQWLIAGLLALACYTGRPGLLVALVMWANLAASMIFSREPGDVATADLVAVVLLVGTSNALAFLFVAMQPVYIGGYYFGLSEASIYTIVDVLAICQFVLLGGWHRGVGNLYRRVGRGFAAMGNPLDFGAGHAGSGGVAMGHGRQAQDDMGKPVQVFSRSGGKR